MERGLAGALEVRVVPPSHLEEVLREFGSERFKCNARNVDYLQAFEGEYSVGLLGLEWSAGGTVWLWGPEINQRENAAPQVAKSLLIEANHQIKQKQISQAQVLLNSSQLTESGWYREVGYDKVVSLELLVRPISSDEAAPDVPPVKPVCHFRYTAKHHARFAKTLAACYEESEDCLAANRQSEPEKSLADYRDTAFFDPALWFLFQSGNTDFGCLLMTHDTSEALLEIVYLGLSPSFRGRGFGHWAAAMAISEAKRLHCRQLTVAVDTQNTAARGLYAHWGFWCFASKSVHIWTP